MPLENYILGLVGILDIFVGLFVFIFQKVIIGLMFSPLRMELSALC